MKVVRILKMHPHTFPSHATGSKIFLDCLQEIGLIAHHEGVFDILPQGANATEDNLDWAVRTCAIFEDAGFNAVVAPVWRE
jgi:hypothetical protein